MSEYTYDETSYSCIRDSTGKAVGTPATHGYLRVKWREDAGYKTKAVHRIVWEMFNGAIKDGYQIDHINGNKADNRIANLREVTPAINSRNKKRRSDNVTGMTGFSRQENYGGHAYYVFQWHNNGVAVRKRFSVAALGEEAARNAALQFRETQLEAMSAAGYTERHINGNT